MAILERIELFRGLNPASREILERRAVVRRYPAGGVLWTAGSRPRGLFALVAGRVRIVRGAGGRQHVVHTEGAGTTIGEVPLFAGGDYPATAVAAEPVVCAVIDAATLEAAMAADPRLALRLLTRMAERVRGLVDRLDGRSSRTVGERLAEWLLARGQDAPGSFTLGVSQADLAEELGTVREVLVRELRRLREAGVIRPAAGRRWEIVDAAALRRAAGG